MCPSRLSPELTQKEKPDMRLILTFAATFIWTLASACSVSGPASDGARDGQVYFLTSNRSEVVVIDGESPQHLPNREAMAAYQQGYSHMLNTSWSSAIAAYDEADRLKPGVASFTTPEAQPTCMPFPDGTQAVVCICDEINQSPRSIATENGDI